MKKIKINKHSPKFKKKASAEIGFAIIVMAILLLFGGMFFHDNSINSKQQYINQRNQNNEGINDSKYPSDTYLFYLNDTVLGRQSKIIESFPNIELGSQTEFNVIHIENNFELFANPFAKSHYSFTVNFDNPQDVDGFLLYFTPDRSSGNENLIISIDGETKYEPYNNKARSSEIPIRLSRDTSKNTTSAKITIELNKPHFYDLFNWNKMEIKNLKVVEIRKKKSNNKKSFMFKVDKEELEHAQINLVIDCLNSEKGDSIKVGINGYSVADFVPECTSHYLTINKDIPLNILKPDSNKVTFESEGFYKMAYNFNKIYFNDKENYKFNINSFNDISDVVIYGDFDKEAIDLRINSQTITLSRNDIKSIISYLRFGTNELKILTKPLEIKDLIIEKNEFY